MSTAKPTGTRYLYIQRRKYWARFGIPADVREAFGGRSEHWENLNTDHLRTAKLASTAPPPTSTRRSARLAVEVTLSSKMPCTGAR